MVLHEEGFVVVCCLCDTYFVLTTGYVAPASYRGKAGTERLDTRNELDARKYTFCSINFSSSQRSSPSSNLDRDVSMDVHSVHDGALAPR